MMDGDGVIRWADEAGEHALPYVSARGSAAPARVIAADDRLTADEAFRLASQGTAIVWAGDYHNARQLLQGYYLPQRLREGAERPAYCQP